MATGISDKLTAEAAKTIYYSLIGSFNFSFDKFEYLTNSNNNIIK
nr:hypothetical protein [Borreliella turdi]